MVAQPGPQGGVELALEVCQLVLVAEVVHCGQRVRPKKVLNVRVEAVGRQDEDDVAARDLASAPIPLVKVLGAVKDVEQAVHERLEALDNDLETFQNEVEKAAMDHFREKRNREKEKAKAFLAASPETAAWLSKAGIKPDEFEKYGAGGRMSVVGRFGS